VNYEIDMKKAAAKLQAAKVGMEKSLGIFERYKQLSSLGIASQTEMDRAEIAYEKSVADYQIALEDSKALQTRSKQGRIEAQANLLKAQKDVESIHLKLEKCTIKAPIGGIVASKKKWPGENVEPRDSVIVTIVQIEKVFAEVDLSERNLGSIKMGQQAEVRADAYPHIPFKGEVQMISPMIDSNSRTVKVKVKVSNDQQLLKIGMFVRVNIVLEDLKDRIGIPEGGVIASKDGKQRAFVILEDVAFLREIHTGIRKDGWIVVSNGIIPGERVVVEGQEKLRDLTPVQPTEVSR
jgi:RND family efflux transporter MFP subunit